MRKLIFSSLFITASIVFCGNLQAQELAKPIPNKTAVKQKTEKSQQTATTDGNSSTGNQTKAGIQKADDQSVNNRIVKEDVNANPYQATRDDSDYQAKKAKWIEENPEKYKACSGNPNLVIMTEEELQKLPVAERNRILADEENYIIIK